MQQISGHCGKGKNLSPPGLKQRLIVSLEGGKRNSSPPGESRERVLDLQFYTNIIRYPCCGEGPTTRQFGCHEEERKVTERDSSLRPKHIELLKTKMDQGNPHQLPERARKHQEVRNHSLLVKEGQHHGQRGCLRNSLPEEVGTEEKY